MYHEVKKINKKKRIELLILVAVLIWGLFLLIDYVRYDSGKPPIFAIKNTIKYTDGEVREWLGIGYVYREYERVPVTRVEFVPFWVLRENPKDRGELPVAHSGYEVPDNPDKKYKHHGLLYFYNKNKTLIGTYKCINTSGDCDRVVSGWDDYHLAANEFFGKDDSKFLGMEEYRFVFIDDSANQNVPYGHKDYERIIYLFDIEKNEILAKFADVKSSIPDDKNNYSIAKNKNYILKDWDTGKWGIRYLNTPPKDDLKTELTLDEVLPYEYDSITYDKDTGYYILCKEGKWFIYDLKTKKVVSAESVEPIYDVWINYNNSYYFKTGVTNKASGETTFKIFKINGQEFFNETGVTVIYPKEDYYFYLSTYLNQIVFKEYSGDVVKTVPLYFTSLKHDGHTLPCFDIAEETSRKINIRVYHGSAIGSKYDTHYINTKNWGL